MFLGFREPQGASQAFAGVLKHWRIGPFFSLRACISLRPAVSTISRRLPNVEMAAGVVVQGLPHFCHWGYSEHAGNAGGTNWGELSDFRLIRFPRRAMLSV